MSRSMLLVFLLIVLIITSQFEWRQPFVSDLDTSPGDSQKQPQVSKREGVKEKIILSQEKNIQRLNELITSLKEQLQQCRHTSNTNETLSGSQSNTLTENLIELEQQQILED